ncbi:aminotransferase class IV [Nonomuraea ferruginea]
MSSFVVHRDGHPATAAELAPLAFAGYAHFTAMQVRGGRVRGLDLHLERLRSASMELFGRALPDDQVRARLRSALLAGPADLSLTATVYSPAGEFTATDLEPSLLVRTGPPASGPPRAALAGGGRARTGPPRRETRRRGGQDVLPAPGRRPRLRRRRLPRPPRLSSAKGPSGTWPSGTGRRWCGPRPRCWAAPRWPSSA